MYIQAVGNRCAVHFSSLHLPITDAEALRILEEAGYRVVEVDLTALARERIGKAEYRRGARMRETPDVFDCSSFTKWLYAQLGFCLPRYSIEQWDRCAHLPDTEPVAGALAFSSGTISWYWDDPGQGIGHVGYVTPEATVIHAANSKEGVIEEPLAEWKGWKGFRGIRYPVPPNLKLVTLECPPDAEIESSKDLRWKILQRLPR